MISQNSHVDYYVDLLSAVLRDNHFPKSAQTSFSRDEATLRRRVRGEGFSFLTTTLPLLGKGLEVGLESGSMPQVPHFTVKPGCTYPEFLSGAFSNIFGADGLLLSAPDALSVRLIRQICFLFYKIEASYSETVVSLFLQKFEDTDRAIGDLVFSPSALSLISGAGNVLTKVFDEFDSKTIVPRHGPGAVSTGERLEQKWDFSRLYDDIHQFYPYYDYFTVGGSREVLDRLDWYKSLLRRKSGEAKVILVPKDSRGPRLISCEPLEYQFIQQGLGRSIMSHLEGNFWTKGQVNFTYQNVNQQLAFESSQTRRYATIDLKDASDRVSLSLVERLFANNEQVLLALRATRSTHTLLPSGRSLELSMFAPMGSALCFPVESVCFWALCVAAIQRDYRVDLLNVAHEVFVYGDDIIVPTSYTECVMGALESVGLLVNRQKSFYKGYFRESCGVDAYQGVNVTPVRVKKPFPLKKSDATGFAAWTALANRLMQNGYREASDLVFTRIESMFGLLPFGTSFSGYPCRLVEDPMIAEEFNKLRCRYQFNDQFQRWEFWVLNLADRRRKTDLDGWQRLLKGCVMPNTESDPSVVVIPRATSLERGWSPV